MILTVQQNFKKGSSAILFGGKTLYFILFLRKNLLRNSLIKYKM